jgi:hypothetical protein
MIRQIVIEAELPDEAQSMFRLSINANLIAKGVTVSQAYYLIGEVLGRIGRPEHAEEVTFDANGGARESVGVAEAKNLGSVTAPSCRQTPPGARNLAAVSKTSRPADFYRRLPAAPDASERAIEAACARISGNQT